jgi:hypothetical protein
MTGMAHDDAGIGRIAGQFTVHRCSLVGYHKEVTGSDFSDGKRLGDGPHPRFRP